MKRLAVLLGLLLSLCLLSTAQAAPSLRSVVASPNTVAAGGKVTISVNLSARATETTVVALDSSSTYLDVPSSVRVAKGKKTGSVTVTAKRTSVERRVTVTASLGRTERVVRVTISPLSIASVSLASRALTGGSDVVGTVKLNGTTDEAYRVALSDDSSVLDVPLSVTVRAGQRSATFSVSADAVSSSSKVKITATALGITKTTTVTVEPLVLSKVSGATTLAGGTATTGKVIFNGTTPVGGTTVALSSSDPSLLTVPASVTAGRGVTSVSFPITTAVTGTERTVTVTATYRGVSKTYTVAVKPPALSSVSVDPETVVGGQSAVVRVTITGKAPAGGLVATLASSDAVLTVPATVTIPAGSDTASVTVPTSVVASPKTVTVSAMVGGATQSTTVTVAPVTVQTLTLVDAPTGGNATTLEVNLAGPAPAGGVTVALASSDPSMISLPETLTIPEGERDAELEYLPAVVTEDTTVTLSASLGGATETATVTIKPARFINIGFNPGTLAGGGSSEATITLTGPAPADGYIVDLNATLTAPSSSNPTPPPTGAEPVEVPASLLVPAGARSTRVSVTTSAVAARTAVYIQGSGSGTTVTTRLTVEPPQLRDFNPRPVAITASGTSPITVRLTGPAPAGGVTVSLVSTSTTVATVPASAVVPAGSKSVTVNVTGAATAAVGSSTTIKVTALGKTVEGPGFVTNLQLLDLELSLERVVGGNSLTGTVTLSGPAPTGGAFVGLSVNDESVEIPTAVMVAPGTTTGTFTLRTPVVDTAKRVVVYATYASSAKTADLAITSLGPISLTLDDVDLEGGQTATATITLNGTTPPLGGPWVDATVISSSTAATVPATVRFDRASATATFTVAVSPVAVATDVSLVVEVNGQTVMNTELTIHPPRVAGVTFANAQVTGGTSNTGTVTLTSPAPAGGWQVALSSGAASAVPVANATVPAGATSVTFQVGTTPVAVDTTPVVTAARGGSSADGTFTIKPPRLVSIDVADTDLEGGFAGTALTVTLNGPAPTGGWSVSLTSSTPAALAVPASVTVAAGATTATATATSALVPADASVTLTATKNADSFSRGVTVRQIKVTGVSLSAGSVQGGASVTATVTINRAVPATGVTVALSSGNAAATLPATALVPVGETSVSVSVSSVAVATNAVARVTAVFNGGTASADLTVLAPVVSAVSASPATLVGGGATSAGTVTISHPAPAGGFPVTLEASNGGASVPATVTVAAGATSATFTVSTAVVANDRSVTITASRNGTSATTSIVVQPLVVSTLSISPSAVMGGDQSATATLTLNGIAPAGGAAVAVTSSNTSSATVPATVTVAAGSTSATFTVTTIKRSSGHPVTVTATYNGASRTAGLQVNAPAPTSLSLSNGAVVGGNPSTGTVTLNAAAPAGGQPVSLSSNSAYAVVPASVTVPAGATAATFTVTTLPIPVTATATITATANGGTATANLTINGPTLSSLSINTSSAVGGTTFVATAVISSAAPSGGITVSMASDRSQAAPLAITIPAGQTSGSANVTTQGVAANTVVTLTGSLNGTSRTTSFTITRTTVQGVSVNPTAVKGGNSFSFTVTLNGVAPAGGVTLQAGDDSDDISMPSSITVPAGSSSVTITVTTKNVHSDRDQYVGVRYDSTNYYVVIRLLD